MFLDLRDRESNQQINVCDTLEMSMSDLII
uniref:Uncharacterized protein n=1 Tax=Anguilla anguilla TaxID=7936 RepID=A0A0E9RX01_ANGAN